MILAAIAASGVGLVAASLFLGPFLLPLVVLLAIPALAIELHLRREAEDAATEAAIALGAIGPAVLWGRVARMSGSCPSGRLMRERQPFAFADERTWPALCPHADRVLREALRGLAASGWSDVPVRYHDPDHRFELDVHRARERRPVPRPAWGIVSRDRHGVGAGTTAGVIPTAMIKTLSRGQRVIARDQVEVGELLGVLTVGDMSVLDIERYGAGRDELFVPTACVAGIVGNHVYLTLDSRVLAARAWHEPAFR